jgi:ferredoxin
MKVAVDHDLCIGCGICESTCPQVFVLTDEALSCVIVEEVSEELRDEVTEAVDSCPTECIRIFENGEEVPEELKESIRPDLAP